MTDQVTEYLSRKEAAAYISARGISMALSTMKKYAGLGLGPRFIRPAQGRYGRVVYPLAGIEEWLGRIDPGRTR